MRKSLFSIGFFLMVYPLFGQTHKQYPLFIYSFTRYVQWPEAYTQGDFEILVLGECPVTEELNKMAQVKKTGDRAIRIVTIQSVGEIRKCNILFVPATRTAELEQVLAKVNTQSILVVTEDPGSGARGSCINFITKDGKLAFELNQAAMNKQSLKVANELARWAIII
jgi:hypothetical protein